jgi:hypothetical protein
VPRYFYFYKDICLQERSETNVESAMCFNMIGSYGTLSSPRELNHTETQDDPFPVRNPYFIAENVRS